MAAPHLVRTGPSRGPGTGPALMSDPGPAEPVQEAGVEGSAGTVRSIRSWPLVLLALPAAVAVWSGWVGIGELTGFGQVHPLPGIWNSLHIDTAVTLPIGVEAYAAYALHAWLATGWRCHTGPAGSPDGQRSARCC